MKEKSLFDPEVVDSTLAMHINQSLNLCFRTTMEKLEVPFLNYPPHIFLCRIGTRLMSHTSVRRPDLSQFTWGVNGQSEIILIDHFHWQKINKFRTIGRPSILNFFSCSLTNGEEHWIFHLFRSMSSTKNPSEPLNWFDCTRICYVQSKWSNLHA